jgi:acyl transferase domain-containing protein
MDVTEDPRDRLSPIKRALLEVREMRARVEELERARTEPIAIIGMGVRLPGGVASCDDFWTLLEEGRDAVGEVPPDRWDAQAFHDADPGAAGKIVTRSGGFVDHIDRFDARFFGISPREAASMDPQQRMLLETAWEALEHAGQTPDLLAAQPTGVYVGLGSTDYLGTEIKFARLGEIDPYLATGGVPSVAAGRLSYVLGLKGPSLTVDTACSSSLVAVHLAVQGLRLGECRVALAAGANLLLLPELSVTCSRARMLAPDGRCKTFDDSADGYVRSEGCGVVVLKRLCDARADGDRVAAVIRGTAVNQDGRSSGLTVPNGRAQEAVITEALRRAEVAASDVSYVEAHGTGTALGDPIELRALGRVFGPREARDRLPVGSVKTNVGHLEAAAGITGLIKVVLALEHDRLPRHLHFQRPTGHVDWSALPLRVPTATEPWPRAGRTRYAGISSFGFSGTNAHVVVGDAPPLEPAAAEAARPLHVLAVSARSPEALRAQAARLRGHLETSADAPADVCYTANAGRVHHRERLAVIGATGADFTEGLAAIADGRRTAPDRGTGTEPGESQAPAVAFLFAGLGGPHGAMGRSLFETQPEFRRTVLRCEEILAPELDRPLTHLLFDDAHATDVGLAQPLLFAFEYALATLWRSWGVEPAFVLGHSLGEDVAACVAGVFSLEDGLKMVARRARLMADRLGDGAMAAVFAPVEQVRARVAESRELAFAAFNGPHHVVLSGSTAAVRAASEACAAAHLKVRPLAVGKACHSPLMDPVLDDIERLARAMARHAPRLGMASTLTGRMAAPDELADPGYWRNHVRMPVRFGDAVQALYDAGARLMLEIGPDGIVTRMGSRALAHDDATWLSSLDSAAHDEWKPMLRSLAALYEAGVGIDWRGFDRGYGRRIVSLPTYPFERQRYWNDAVRPRVPEDGSTRREVWESEDLYEVAWRPAAPVADGVERPRASWIVLADRQGIGAAIAAALEERGDECLQAHARHEPADDEAGRWTVDPDDGAGFSRLLSAAPHGLRGIINCWPLDAAPIEGASAAALDRAGALTCGGVLGITRALASGTVTAPQWVLTRHAVRTSGHDRAPEAAQAMALGFGRVVSIERPDLWGGLVDIDDRPPHECAADVLGWIDAALPEEQVALRRDGRFVPRVTRAKGVGFTDVPLRHDATYLVAGGLGSVGLRVADELARQGAGTLVLVSRSAMPEPSKWDVLPLDQGTRGRIAALRQIEGRGCRVVLAHGDLADDAAVDRLGRLLAELPPVRGVVQAMAASGEARVHEMTPAQVRAMLAPKVQGTVALDRLTAESPLDFFVLFSSMAGVIGAAELAHYSAANAFLDAFAAARRRRDRPIVSVSWGLWSLYRGSEAMHRAIDSGGMRAMDVGHALDAFTKARGADRAHVAFASVDWGRLKPLFELKRARPHLDELGDRATAVADPTASMLLTSLERAKPADRAALLEAHVRREAAQVLDLPVSDLDPRRGLFDMGMDSLMSLNLKNRLEAALARPLPTTLTFNHPTVAALTAYLMGEVFATAPADAPRTAAIPQPPPEGARDDGELSEDDLASMLASRLEQLRS